MPLIRAAAAFAACLVAATAMADPAPHPDQPLTLVQLTDLALSNNPATKLAWAEIRNGEAGVELARSGYWPQISADYSIDREGIVFSGKALAAETNFGPSVSLSYLLWDFGTRSGATDAAKFTLASAQLSGNQTVQDLILSVEQDYYQALESQALVEADQESVKDASALLDAAQQRRVAGLATIGDVYQAEAALATADLALQQAQGQLAVSRGQLAVAVGYSVDTDLPLAPWAGKVRAQLPAKSVQQLLQDAKDSRPEILASKAQVQSAVSNLEATEGRGWPTLGLTASGQRTRSLIGGQNSTATGYNAGLTLSFPLFTGFADQAANRQAQAAVDTAQASADQLLLTVELEVWQAYQNLITAASSLDTTDTGLKSAQEASDVTNARYKGGLGSILDVLSAQATLANARVQQVQARLNWFAAQTAMGHAVGGLTAPQDNTTELP